jgi:hypothetical protein
MRDQSAEPGRVGPGRAGPQVEPLQRALDDLDVLAWVTGVAWGPGPALRGSVTSFPIAPQSLRL